MTMLPLFRDDDQPDTLSVGEVNARIERAVRDAFPLPVWVKGEIHNLSRPKSGHVYFDLVGDGSVLRVTLWSSEKYAVNATLKRAGNAVRMAEGTEVRIRAEVGWWGVAGRASLRMLAIDPAFTLGRLAEARAVLLQQLAGEGLLRAQDRLVLAAVPLRVGLVTSVGSAAHADVLRTLQAGFAFEVLECDVRVQGDGAAEGVARAVRSLAARGVDVVCVVRGGGARTDLAAFDAEVVARAIATAPVPVLTGIGHETDTSVADEVAWERHKTPTACAGFLVERVRSFCDRRDATFDRLVRAASSAAQRATARLDQRAGAVSGAARHRLVSDGARVDLAAERIARRAPAVLAAASARVDDRAARVTAADPARLLARGWTITRTAGGALVRSPADAPAGTHLHTTTSGGVVQSTVTAGEEPS